jgi:HSP20 family protein
MNDPFDAFFSNMPAPQATPNLMRTDIKETEDGIEIVIDLPGFDKENVAAELKDGVLKVSAKTSTENEENTGTYLRRERFSGQCSRQFFVGEDIEEADIKAKFDNGTLQISVPKKVEQPKLEESRTIAIEG